jgi:apolipoprotein N-acyltransferase
MRVVAALLSGALYALAFPTGDHAWCAWIALVPVLLALRGTSPGSAFCYGALFGYATGWCVLWPLANTGVSYFQLPWPLAVAGAAAWFLIVVGLPSALFAVGASAAVRGFALREAALVVPALWVATEMLRTRFIEQPWALLGYTQHSTIGIIQIAAWTGVYGVSFLLVLANVAIAEAIARAARHAPRAATQALLAPALVIGLCWIGGSALLPPAPRADEPAAGAHQVSVIQTNIAPARTWTPAYTAAQIAAHVRATATLGRDAAPSLVVWPEYAVPRYVEQDAVIATLLRNVARDAKADLLVGAPRFENDRSFNSARLIHADGRVAGHYDKRRLVPFAEQPALSWLSSRNDSEAFATGTTSGVLPSFARLGVSICHEILHPDLILAAVRDGAEVLVNLANDGWVGGSSPAAAEQHLAMATFRAVETRRYLVRAALTGVSAVVDPFGRVVASLPAGAAGVLTASVVPHTEMTWYARVGDVFGWGCVLIALLGLAALDRRHRHAAVPAPVPVAA